MNQLLHFTFSTIGLISSFIGIHYLTNKENSFYLGMAFPFMIIGSALLLPREKIFTWNHAMVRYIYSSLIFLGIILMCYGANHHWSKGLGFGLFIQCIFVLMVDSQYTKRISSIS